MASLLKLLPNSKRAGVFQTAIDTDEIVAAAKTAGLDVFKLDLGGARGKRGLLDRLAMTLRFPAYFGKNWDALNDCLTDLQWLSGKGLVVIVTNADNFAEKHDEIFHTAIDVLNQAVAYWHGQKKPFWVLVQTQTDLPLKLPKIVSE